MVDTGLNSKASLKLSKGSRESLHIDNQDEKEKDLVVSDDVRELNSKVCPQEGEAVLQSKIFDESIKKTEVSEQKESLDKQEKDLQSPSKVLCTKITCHFDDENKSQTHLEDHCNEFQAKLYKQDLTNINPELHKEIHLTEGKALLLNIQLKQFSYWNRFEDVEKDVQCNLHQEEEEQR